MEQVGFRAGIDFAMVPAGICRPGEAKRCLTLEDARQEAIETARNKVRHVVNTVHALEAHSLIPERTVVVGADTVILAGNGTLNRTLLQPAESADPAEVERVATESRWILEEQAGKTISVVTGLVVAQADRLGSERSASVATRVFIKKFSVPDIERFVAAAGCFDEAGVLGTREPGLPLFDTIEGSFSNLAGLPLAELYELLRDNLVAGRVHFRSGPTHTSTRKPHGVVVPDVSPRILIASRSPQRFALLSRLIAPERIEVRPARHPEDYLPAESPRDRVVRLACEKARAVLERKEFSGSIEIVVAADTEVVVPGGSGTTDIVAHPHGRDEAVAALRRLSGKDHLVITGIAVAGLEPDAPARRLKIVSECVSTSVTFKRLSEEEILDYVGSGECLGRAGAYAIQGKGAVLVEKIAGSYSNVVGLPLERLAEILDKEFGLASCELSAPPGRRQPGLLKDNPD